MTKKLSKEELLKLIEELEKLVLMLMLLIKD
jgi:hypothetical protein